MDNVHRMIIGEGVEEARKQAVTKHERAVVEAAYQVLSDEADKVGFTYSGFALTCLPHKPQQEDVWRREGHNLTMVLQSGINRAGASLGLPYGSYARFILLFLQSEAVKKGSREIELGRSMRVWLGQLGLSIGGKTYRMVNEQARRISGCSLTFFADRGAKEIMRRGGFVDGSITMADVLSDQPGLWQDRVLLNEEFYRALRDHPVPLSESALRAIGPRSAVIDIYVWLAYRLHVLISDVGVSWPALYAQFGNGYVRLRKFRGDFLNGLELAMAVYPDARVVVEESGIVLRPSRPSIIKRTPQVLTYR
ncbi:MAG: replication protein RepA [Burkholderiaceae bacterium]